ncbi:MAG: hypothetical protein HFJ52_01770 [Clostridia bacterium]|nr:hypothetical protein [Clostridia bacterium]
MGFKDYDTLIFNDNNANDSLSPFSNELWNKAMEWYKVFAVISGSLIIIAVFILSYKIILAGMNTAKKNEAKESLMRLLFGGVAIALAPFFIRFLLFINNSMVHLLVTVASNSSLEGFLGNNMLSSIRTGNAITTALVIAMFIYLFVKLNIKFIVRQFTLIIFTIFTPIAVALWIINKNVTAASIWAGQIIMNIFMQFVYCFLFLMYLAFLPSGGGWAVSLIWAMMILPLADALMNCLQNLTSRIAGVDNEQMTNRVLGTTAMLGFGLGAIKEQFNTPSMKSNSSETNTSNSGFKGIVSRAKSIINPSMNLSPEKDYLVNINPIRNVTSKPRVNNSTPSPTPNINSKVNIEKSNYSQRSNVSKIVNTGAKITKSYLNMGVKMAEGNFNSSKYTGNSNTRDKNINSLQHTKYINNSTNNKNFNELGDNDELK